MTIFTIGYEGLDLATFMALLQRHGVDTVIDIRELPLSRKRGFSKKALADALQLAGFGYVHQARLGCPRPVRKQYRADGDWGRYTQDFLVYLDTQHEAIAELAEHAAQANCALLCYEADFRQCHRSMVADAVSRHSGAAIHHVRSSRDGARMSAKSAMTTAANRVQNSTPCRGTSALGG